MFSCVLFFGASAETPIITLLRTHLHTCNTSVENPLAVVTLGLICLLDRDNALVYSRKHTLFADAPHQKAVCRQVMREQKKKTLKRRAGERKARRESIRGKQYVGFDVV